MPAKTTKSKVIVYSTQTCPYCHAAKDFLKENKIAFQDIDVSKDQAKAQEMIEKSGQMGVPVIDINGTIIVGYDKEAIKKALKLK
jgi:glutaredoxin-like YruB-family protein